MESEILYPGRLVRDPVDSVSTGYGVHPHLDRVFLAVVDNANRHIGLPEGLEPFGRDSLAGKTSRFSKHHDRFEVCIGYGRTSREAIHFRSRRSHLSPSQK